MQEKEVAAEIAARQANMAGTIVTEVPFSSEEGTAYNILRPFPLKPRP